MQGSLAKKKVIVAVCGSIAAYKSAYLVRQLIKQGAEVKVIMTPSATEFISALTLSTLSKNAVHQNVIDGDAWDNHVELGLWADAMVIAPATATTLGRCANGIADNMVVATYLSAKCPVFFAPAMDLDMWKHGSTANNLEQLRSYGNVIIPVGHGELASGLHGDGRMAEPEEIVSFLTEYFQKKTELATFRVVVNAGPTHEPIDPVRYIGNRSSGKMGIAIAEAFSNQGAHVTLVLGPTHLSPVDSKIDLVRVNSAEDMYKATSQAYQNADVGVLAAAVADYTPKEYAAEKIKKKEGDFQIPLKRTTDIAKTLGAEKRANQILVGFALETTNERANAQKKLESKNFDFIVLNSLKDQGAGFEHDTNQVTFIFPNNMVKEFELKSKTAVAEDIVEAVHQLIQRKK